MSETVEPRLSRGLRDLLPEQMLARQWMVDTIRGVYELYGFVPLATPAIEYLDVLSGCAGQEAQQSIFRVSNPEEGGARPALRPDGAARPGHRPVPRPAAALPPLPGRARLARRQAGQGTLPRVHAVRSRLRRRRVARSPTPRSSPACATRSPRCDVGPLSACASPAAAILNLLLAYAGIPQEQGVDVFRVLDKLDKVGIEKVRLELTDGYNDESGDTIRGVGLANEQVDQIERFLAIRSDDRREVAGAAPRALRRTSRTPTAQLDVVERISNHLYALGYGDDQVSLDLSIARGLAYYTGPVFEAILLDAPQFGSVFGGGRYDDLVMRFLGERMPAVGASIGVDRLLAALTHLGRIGTQKVDRQVLVTNMDPALDDDYLAMTWELRRAGIPTELYLGTAKGSGQAAQVRRPATNPARAPLRLDREGAAASSRSRTWSPGREKAETLADRKE